MRAVVCTEYGPPDALQLQTCPDPTCGAGQVVLEIHAAGVNFVDSLLVSGQYQVRIPPPFIPGGDCAGIVLQAGENVRHVAVGDRVLASSGIGAFAERLALPAIQVHALPANMSFAAGAAFLQPHATAYFALHERGSLRQGETLLVLGAAGGTGSAAIQIGKAAGARVIAAASSAEKLAAAISLGADATIDYRQQDLRTALKEATSGRGVDLVFDPVGGTLAEAALRSCAENARYLVIGFASGEIPRMALNLPLLKSCQIVGVDWGGFSMRHPQRAGALVESTLQLYADGMLRDPPLLHYPLQATAQALKDLAARRIAGRCVIDVRQ